MRTQIVVIVAPPLKFAASIGETVKDLFVQELIAQSPVEAFDERVLGRLAWCDAVPTNAVFVLPAKDRSRRKLGAIVADDGLRFAGRPDQGVELARNPHAGN